MYGTGFFPTDRASIYQTAEDDLYLVGTSEVPLAGLHGDQILAEDDLPLRYGGHVHLLPPRGRRGGQGHPRHLPRAPVRQGRDVLVRAARRTRPPSTSASSGVQEAILQAIEVPYRVIDIAVGDLGASAARKFDCEAWMPAQEAYREVTSCSNCTDYQARRLRTPRAPRDAAPRRCTRSTARPWRWAARSSRSSRTTSARTARWRCRPLCAPAARRRRSARGERRRRVRASPWWVTSEWVTHGRGAMPRPGEITRLDRAVRRARRAAGGVSAAQVAKLGAECLFFTALGDDCGRPAGGRRASRRDGRHGARRGAASAPDPGRERGRARRATGRIVVDRRAHLGRASRTRCRGTSWPAATPPTSPGTTRPPWRPPGGPGCWWSRRAACSC